MVVNWWDSFGFYGTSTFFTKLYRPVLERLTSPQVAGWSWIPENSSRSISSNGIQTRTYQCWWAITSFTNYRSTFWCNYARSTCYWLYNINSKQLITLQEPTTFIGDMKYILAFQASAIILSRLTFWAN